MTFAGLKFVFREVWEGAIAVVLVGAERATVFRLKKMAVGLFLEKGLLGRVTSYAGGHMIMSPCYQGHSSTTIVCQRYLEGVKYSSLTYI